VPERFRTLTRFLLTFLLVFGASATMAAPAQARPAGGCVVKITRFAFRPANVHGGDLTKLWLAARNCTDQTLQLTVTEYGKRIPPCPTVDPIAHRVTMEPFGRYRPRPLKMIAPPCNGVEVMVVTFADMVR
jgi:hypothetical protein